jgi:hypothetical protein
MAYDFSNEIMKYFVIEVLSVCINIYFYLMDGVRWADIRVSLHMQISCSGCK